MVSAVVPQKTHLLCAGLYQVRWEHVPERTDRETTDTDSNANGGNITAGLNYLIRSKKASAGLTCSMVCCFPNSSLEPFPGWMMSTIIIPIKTAMKVVVM